MRRMLSTLALAGLLAGAVAAAPDTGAEKQSVSGTVIVPNPTRDAQVVTRHARSNIFLGNQTNGTISYWFKVDPETHGGWFDLSTTTADADLDIIFYLDPGSMTDAPTAAAEFMNAGPGEAGVIPVGSTYAIVYPYSGVNVDFSYKGFEGPTIRLGEDDLDLEIKSGMTVTWVNATGDYAFVDGGSAFGSGSGPASGMAIGDSYSNTFDGFGQFNYTTSAGSGTITVTF